MNYTETWRGLHKTAQFPDTFSTELCRAWNQSKHDHVPYEIDALPLKAGSLREMKQASMRLYAYANRCISLVLGNAHNPDIVFALFNSAGVLLKHYSNAQNITTAQKDGILRLSDWSMNAIGPNAVALGLAYNRPYSTKGIEHYSQVLISKAVYFAPCYLENADGTIPYMLGGVAIILPLEQANEDYLMLSSSIAYDINLHFFMSDTIERAFSSYERGLLNVDENIKTGKQYIMYCDRNLFNVLNIPYSDIFFKPLDFLIDPLPANKQFWDIINTRLTVNDFLVDLTLRGRTENVQITTEPYYQPNLSIKGIRVFISSLKFMSSIISQRIGNTAIFTFDDLVGKTSSFQMAVYQAQAFAKNDKNILITGEVGTGKNVFAQAIHNASNRASGPFISINCASLPRGQLTRLIFGYENHSKHEIINMGYLELANGGTLFLNEINLLPMEFQTALQSAIEKRPFFRVGGYSPVYYDVRIIAATSADIINTVKERKFRPELYYCLNLLNLFIPPLRERKQDITLMADFFTKNLCEKAGIPTKYFSPEAKKLLQSLPWYGNVRELENTIETIVILNVSSIIEPEHILEHINTPSAIGEIMGYRQFNNIKVTKGELERTLQACHFNKQLTAQKLGISRRTLYRYMDKFQIK